MTSHNPPEAGGLYEKSIIRGTANQYYLINKSFFVIIPRDVFRTAK